MKQRIEPADLEGLTDAQKDRLRELWEPQEGNIITPASPFIVPTIRVIGGVDKTFDGEDHILIRDKWFLLREIKNRYLPLLSIGQMIKILGDHWYEKILTAEIGYGEDNYGEPTIEHYYDELCDALWLAVKEIL